MPVQHPAMPLETPELRFERWRARGDGAALSDVFDALAPGLLRLAIHLVGDPASAEDLVQQTFVTAMERAASWDARRPLEPWLQGILANHARDVRKSARRAHDPDFDLEAVLAREEDAPLESASWRELSGELARAVDALDEPYRAAVLLRLRHGMEAADIAHVLGRSPGAVRVQLHRARELLRKSLPAGIASALVLLAEPARGLECVRNQVLEHAARLAPAAGASGALLGGAIVMKKLVVALAVVLIGLATYVGWSRGDEARPERAALATPAVADAHMQELAVAGPLAPIASAARTSEVPPVEAASTNEVLRGIVLDATTNQPIAGARIALYAPIPMTVRDIRTRYWDRVSWTDMGMRQHRPWPHYDAPDSSRIVVPEFTPAQSVDLDPVLVHAQPDAATRPYVETTSDADGRFELSAESTNAFLTCDATGYAQRAFATRAYRLGFDLAADRTIYMSTNRLLRGRIVDSGGEPLHESVALSLYGHSPKQLSTPTSPRIDPQDRRVLFRTDAEGRFEIETDSCFGFVESADARWWVTQHGHLRDDGVTVRETPWFDLVDETGDVRLTLQPACSILVRDAETQAPIEDAYVTLHTTSTKHWLREGWFHLEGGRFAIAPGAVDSEWREETKELQVDTTASTTARVWSPGYVHAAKEIADLYEPGVHEIELVRDPSPPVTGRVRRGAKGIRDARLIAYTTQEGVPRRIAWKTPLVGAVSGDDGAFTLVMPAGRFVLVIEHDGVELRRALDVPCAAVVDVDLDATAQLDVRLTQEDGAPKPARAVRVLDAHGLEARATTDVAGLARIERLAPGTYEVSVSHKPGEDNFMAGEMRSLELLAGPNEIAFVVPGAHALHARLVVEDGPIIGWTARQSSRDSGGQAVASDGRVPLDFSERRHFVLVSPTGVRHAITMPTDAQDGTEVRVRNGGRGYRGRVVDASSGEPLPQLDLWFASESGGAKRTVMATTDADGRFDLRGLGEEARWARTVQPNVSSDSSGSVTFEFTDPPADPPAEVLLRRPRFVHGEYEGFPTAMLEGRFPADATAAVGALAYVSAIVRGDAYSTWMSYSPRVGPDGIFRARVAATGDRNVALWGGEPYRKLAKERWTPSGADPEVREFTLLP